MIFSRLAELIIRGHFKNLTVGLLPRKRTQTKNGEGRIIPMNRNEMDVLTSLPPRRPTDRFFPGINGFKISVAFRRACKKAGIEDFRFHDLRHTTGSWLAMQGKDIYTIAKILGHKDLRMSARYAHLSNQYLTDAVKGLDAVFGNLRPQPCWIN